MRAKHLLMFLAACLIVLGAADYLSSNTDFDQFFADDAKLPKTFRISPAKASIYIPIKVIHNPAEDIYVAFVWELDYKKELGVVHSRVYNNKGRPKGPFHKIAPLTFSIKDHAPVKYLIMFADVCYNSTDNKFLLIYSYQFFDGIYGMELNERGNREGITSFPFTMKKRLNKNATGLYPRIVWMPEKNQYAMGWTYVDASSSSLSNPKNGYYLATFTSYLTPKKVMKKVKSIRLINRYYPLTTFIAAGSKLLWGTQEDIDDTWLRPIVWMTKSNGKNLSPDLPTGAGVKYPGKKVKYGGRVFAGYNPGSDLFLLTWNTYDARWEEDRTFQENRYRLMDGNGNFIGKEKKLPLVENFQSSAVVTYDEADNHFFLTCVEYKVLAEAGQPLPVLQQDSKFFWGGRFWGYQIDTKGKQIGSRIALSKVFTDINSGLYYIEEPYYYAVASYNASDDQHVLTYYLVDFLAHKSKAFGLIYK